MQLATLMIACAGCGQIRTETSVRSVERVTERRSHVDRRADGIGVVLELTERQEMP